MPVLVPCPDELIALRHAAVSGRRSLFRNISHSTQTGALRSHMKGSGLEFEEVRPYAHGDDIRAIDWRVTARTDETHTKLFREEKGRTVFFLVDTSLSMAFGTRGTFKNVQAARITALLGWKALSEKEQVSVLLYNEQSPRYMFEPPAAAAGTFVRSLMALCDPALYRHPSLDHSLSSVISCITAADILAKETHGFPRGSTIIIISDFLHPGEDIARRIAFLRRKHRVTGIAVDDPADSVVPSRPFGCISPDSGVVRTVHLTSRQRAAYSRHQEKNRTYIQRAFGRDFFSVQTKDSVAALSRLL